MYDVDGDNVLSFRESTMSIFRSFCPAIESPIGSPIGSSTEPPIAHMFSILKTELLAKKIF